LPLNEEACWDFNTAKTGRRIVSIATDFDSIVDRTGAAVDAAVAPG